VALPARLCTRSDELGCVVAYQSRPAGGKVGKPAFALQKGNEMACVSPCSLGGWGTDTERGRSRTARFVLGIRGHRACPPE
jgi:hypothetical protein